MTAEPACRRIVARHGDALRPTLSNARPLVFADGANPAADLPGHVRAASAVRRAGSRIVIVQDDVNAIALLDTADGRVRPLLLPAGRGGERVFDDLRGNKACKLDLEACATLPDGRLVALGSGSSARREHVVVLDAGLGKPRMVDAAPLYSGLRAYAETHGAELNIEGAFVQGDRFWLVQRGHGKRPNTHWNALIALDLETFLRWLHASAVVPQVLAVTEVSIGTSAGGVPFGFTDATLAHDGRVAFLACAEDSADVLTDGPVLGCRFGFIDEPAGDVIVADVLEPDGRPTLLKLEGIEARPGRDDSYDVVADMDRPAEPAVLAELQLG
ncbi:MAG TPA: hypothetical protein VFP48_02185 [Steroidobacteraceae bacterium]|nr:hypothetical protein [Steroidobacteraceae bacterium]